MSKALSLKLNNNIFGETEEIINIVKIPRNTYINKAVDFYNKLNHKKILKKQLEKESKLVQDSSIEILMEFEKIEDNLLD